MKFHNVKLGIQEVSLNTKKLYPNTTKREKFEDRLKEFLKDEATSEVFPCKKGMIRYKTEMIIPKLETQRIPLLMLLGNPASHSVRKKMFFSYEGKGREHRFWRVLDKSNIFPFKEQTEDLNKRNKLRKQKLLSGDYESPFLIGLATFYSMPSPASGKWGGINGIKRLLRKKAMDVITQIEKNRIEKLIKDFLAPNGLVITFQKDAYEQIRSNDMESYSIEKAKNGTLKGNCRCASEIELYGFSPTRLMYSNLKRLQEITTRKKYILGQ